MKIRLRTFYRMIGVLAILLWPDSVWSQWSAAIDQANRFYNENQFENAIELYEQVMDGGMENGHVYYNLGNAYFRAGNLPMAILNYIKAQKLLPRNEDVAANLEYAIRQTSDQLDGRKPHFLESVFFWIGDLSWNEQGAALLWINLAFWIAMALRLRYKNPTLHSAGNLLLGLLILAGVSTGFRWFQESRQSVGVILPRQIDVHSGWNTNAVVLFKLHQGTPVSISQEKDNWYEIELSDGEKGWALKSHIAE